MTPEEARHTAWSFSVTGLSGSYEFFVSSDRPPPMVYALEALHAKEAVPRLLTLVNDDRTSRVGALVTVSEAAKAAIATLQ